MMTKPASGPLGTAGLLQHSLDYTALCLSDNPVSIDRNHTYQDRLRLENTQRRQARQGCLLLQTLYFIQKSLNWEIEAGATFAG